MRTKKVLLSSLCGLVSVVAVNAQVYSVNAVGYVNMAFDANELKLFTNPLNTTNTLAALFNGFVLGSPTIYKWDSMANAYDSYVFTGVKWINGATGADANNVTLNPGEGAFMLADTQPFTVTFVGEVMQGQLTNFFVNGLTLVGSQVPQDSDIVTLKLSQSLTPGTSLYKWNGTGWSSYIKRSAAESDWIDGLNGKPSIPSLGVGEGVFVFSTVSGSWVRTFDINLNQ